MAVLVLFAALLGFASARPEVYFLPSGIPYLQGKENLIPYASPIQIHVPTAVPIPAPVRVGLPEDHKIKSHLHKRNVAQEKKVNSVSNEHKTPASTVLYPDVQPFATRQLVFNHGFPIPYAYPQRYAHFTIGEVVPDNIVVKQVFGSPVWDRKVIEWASKNCPSLPLFGGAVAGASGGPIGVVLGILGAAIGACNFNN